MQYTLNRLIKEVEQTIAMCQEWDKDGVPVSEYSVGYNDALQVIITKLLELKNAQETPLPTNEQALSTQTTLFPL